MRIGRLKKTEKYLFCKQKSEIKIFCQINKTSIDENKEPSSSSEHIVTFLLYKRIKKKDDKKKKKTRLI